MKCDLLSSIYQNIYFSFLLHLSVSLFLLIHTFYLSHHSSVTGHLLHAKLLSTWGKYRKWNTVYPHTEVTIWRISLIFHVITARMKHIPSSVGSGLTCAGENPTPLHRKRPCKVSTGSDKRTDHSRTAGCGLPGKELERPSNERKEKKCTEAPNIRQAVSETVHRAHWCILGASPMIN